MLVKTESLAHSEYKQLDYGPEFVLVQAQQEQYCD